MSDQRLREADPDKPWLMWPGICPECLSEDIVVGETGGGRDGLEAKCRKCGHWFDPDSHPAGCFYGTFAGAYASCWHIPAGVECSFAHGPDAIQLLAGEPHDQERAT